MSRECRAGESSNLAANINLLRLETRHLHIDYSKISTCTLRLAEHYIDGRCNDVKEEGLCAIEP